MQWLQNLDLPLLKIIMECCAVAPQARHNQIGNTCRRCELAWRSNFRRVLADLLKVCVDEAKEVNWNPIARRNTDTVLMDCEELLET